MSAPFNLYSFAATVAEQLLYSVVAGTILSVAVGLVLRLLPRKSSRTNFAVWFSTLLLTAASPLLRTPSSVTPAPGHPSSSASLITVPTSWALYIFLAWAVIAFAGLARVALATWQLHRLRSAAGPLDLRTLAPELRALIEDFRSSRPVSLLVSRRLEVPTAIGFFKPAVVLPAWLLEETPAEELKYILLHELAHLRRRDDWTNLAQKLLKALLFFLPSVWWIDRRLTLDREMACDDAVLDHSGTARGYAECLTHVAARSFLRRQLALAQAAVSRARHLTLRVSRILDPGRTQAARLWKPAVPVVVVIAGLCGLSTSSAPSLVSFTDDAKGSQQLPAPAQHSTSVMPAKVRLPDASGSSHEVHAWEAGLRTSSSSIHPRPPISAERRPRRHERPNVTDPAPPAASEQPAALAAANQPSENPAPGYFTVREELLVVVTQRTTPSGQETLADAHLASPPAVSG